MARRTTTTASIAPIGEPLETRERLKLAARRLFAQRGIDGVTVRDIVAEGGQRNAASIFYYFGTKEALVQELIVDGARLIDERRNAALDLLERRPEPPTLREVVETIIRTSFAEPPEPEGDRTYLRFIAMLQTSHRALFLEAVGERWNRGFKRALAQIRRLLPEVASPILSQRLILMSIYLGGSLAAREAAMNDPGRRNSALRGELAICILIDTVEAMLSAASHKSTFRALPSTTTASPRARKG